MWKLRESAIWAGKFRRYAKRHKAAMIAAMDNLDTYVRCLNGGIAPHRIRAGFIHHESQGVVGIDQRHGGGRRLRETRVYIYVSGDEETVYLITVGDKDSQQRDLRECEKFVRALRKG